MMDNNHITNGEERILKSFFAENKAELPDDGFTERVMDSLPHTARRRNFVWTMVCGLAAVVFFLLADGADRVRIFVTNATQGVMSSLSAVHLDEVNVQSIEAAVLVVLFLGIVSATENRSIL